MTTKKVYSVCGMCTVRCPIQVDVKDGVCTFIQGNPTPQESTGPCVPVVLPGLR